MKWLRESQGRLFLEVAAIPNARKTQIVGVHNERLKIKVQAPPTEGRANKEILDFLAGVLDVKKNQIRLHRGEASRQKSFQIIGMDYSEVLIKLSASSSKSG